MIIFTDKDEETKLLTVKVTVRRDVRVQELDMADIVYQEVYFQIDEVSYPNSTLRAEENDHSTELTKSMQIHGIDYCHDRITVSMFDGFSG